MAERVVIIGGTAGIGLAAARRFLRAGAEVVIAGRDRQRLEAAIASLHGESNGDSGMAQGRLVDAGDKDQLTALFADLAPVDHVVVTVTHTGGVSSLADLDMATVRAHSEGKLVTHLQAVQASVGALRPSGSITLVSSISAQLTNPGTVLLAAVNAAIEAAVRVLAAELAPIRVNAVSPGMIDTGWWDWLPDTDRQQALDNYAKTVPVGRVGTADDVADAIAFVAGNTFTTGVVLPCDGGLAVT